MTSQPSKKLNRALSIVFLLLVLGAIAAIGYAVSKSPGNTFTEFYILNAQGEATDYPAELRAGEPVEVILGIVNQEQAEASYSIEIRIDGVKSGEMGPIALEPDGRSERVASIVADKPGKDQKVEFLLYRQGQDGVYQSLHLWVDVVE